MTDIQPGEIIGDRWQVGEAIGLSSAGTECDAPDGGSYMMLDGAIRCRCTICPRCGHHTGNAHQGHYWALCKVTGALREFHFCCPESPGCELEAGAEA